MTITVTNADREDGGVERYKILRHLFNAAVESSVSDRRWVIFSTFTDPGRTILTEYECATSGDRIKSQAFDFSDGVYRKIMYTFTQKHTI